MKRSTGMRHAHQCLLFFLLAAALAFRPGPAQGAVKTWLGNTDANWSTGPNWSPSALAANDTPTFGTAGSGGVTLTNDTAASTTYAGIVFSNSASAFTIGGEAITLGGGITVGTGITSETINLPITLGGSYSYTVNSGTLTLGGTITGGAQSMTKAGVGALVLAAANYTGATTVNGGTLTINGASSTLSSGSGLTFNYVQGGCSFIYDNVGASSAVSQTLASLTAPRAVPTDHTVQITRTAAQPVTLTISAQSFQTIEDGVAVNYVTRDVAGGGVNGADYKIVLADQTAFRITEPNCSYFNGGDFAVYEMSGGGGLNGYVRGVNYGVDPQTASYGAGQTIAATGINMAQVTGNITDQPSATLGASSGGGQNNGALRIVGDSSITLAPGAVLTIQNVNDTGTKGIVKTGGGTSVIGGGASVIQTQKNGMIRVDGPTDVLDIAMQYNFSGSQRNMKSGAGTLIFSSGTISPTTTFWVNGGVLEIGGSAAMAWSASLVLAQGAFFKYNSSAASTFSQAISGGGGVEVSAGMLTLSAANTHTGGTTVSGGTLRVNNATGSGTGTGVVTVKGGAKLGGTGTAGGDVSVESGAALAPGSDGIGTLHVGGNLTVAQDAALDWDFAPATSDQVAVDGTLTLPASMVLNVNMLEAGDIEGQVLFTYGAYSGPARMSFTAPGMEGSFAAINEAANKRIVLSLAEQGLLFIVR